MSDESPKIRCFDDIPDDRQRPMKAMGLFVLLRRVSGKMRIFADGDSCRAMLDLLDMDLISVDTLNQKTGHFEIRLLKKKNLPPQPGQTERMQ